MVEVRLFAQFREGREKTSYFDSSDYPTPRAILEHFEIEEKSVAILLINGFHKELDTPLENGDVLALFPPVAGG